MVHTSTEHIYHITTFSHGKEFTSEDTNFLMAHAFLPISERELDFLTFVESVFSLQEPSFAGTGKTGIYKSNFDLRYFDRLYTAGSVSMETTSSLSLIQNIQSTIGYTSATFARHTLRESAIRQIFISDTLSRAALTICDG